MTSSNNKQCPRCKTLFECNANNQKTCQCDSIALNEEHRQYIALHYTDCLCPSCLLTLRREYDNGVQ